MKASTRRNLRTIATTHRRQQIRRDCPHPLLNDGICTYCGNLVDQQAYDARWAKKEDK